MRRALSYLLAAGLLCGAAVLVACKDCQKLEIAKTAACSADPTGEACKLLTAEWERGCAVEPTAPPPPTTTTTTTVPPAPPPTTLPPPPPPVSACPKPLASGAEAYLNNKVYGQGLDSTLRIKGDPELCLVVHGVAVNDCHLEGWPRALECELELLGKTISRPQACPVWEYRQLPDTAVHPALQVGPSEDAMSADHFGNVAFRDDPHTAAFEGQPAVCGEQRDAAGHPMAGFFTVAHGLGQVRACRPDGGGCGPWVSVDH